MEVGSSFARSNFQLGPRKSIFLEEMWETLDFVSYVGKVGEIGTYGGFQQGGQFVTVVLCRKINEAVLMSQLLTYIRERKWGLDQIAQAVGSSSELPIASSSSSSDNPKVQASQNLVNYIGSHLEPFANTVVESDKDRQIADLKRQMEQAKSSSSMEPDPSEAMERPPKRTRLATKQDPTASFRNQVLDFSVVASARPLSKTAPKSMTKIQVMKWIDGLQLSQGQKASLDNLIKGADDMYRSLSSEEQASLPDRAAQLGLPVSLISKAKEIELLRTILTAVFNSTV